MNMKRFDCLKPWLLAGFLGIFLTACATTQEEVIEDGPPSEDQTQMDGGMTTDDTGVDASGIDGGDDGTATAIVDESMMSAAELLEQSEGALSNRTIYFEFQTDQRIDSDTRDSWQFHCRQR
jgi:hypothetical protein